MADTRKQIYEGADTAPTMYVNAVQFGSSPFELRLQMGIIEQADDTSVVTRVSAKVFMSWVHAKIFADLLSQQVARFEAMNGPLTVPQNPPPEANEAGKP